MNDKVFKKVSVAKKKFMDLDSQTKSKKFIQLSFKVANEIKK